MARRDPEAWKRRVKPEPWRRWFLKMAATGVAVLSNIDGTLSFFERLFRRPAPVVVETTGRIVGSSSVKAAGETVLTSITGQLAASEHPDTVKIVGSVTA
jgi:hypothetical protein